MRGHIRERSPGRWAIVLDVRDPETGKRRRRWHSFAGTKRQAQEECSRLITELKGGRYIDPSRMKVSDFLEEWLETVKPQVTPRTHERYAEIVRKNIVPLLGAEKMTKLTPMQISRAYAKALSDGRRDGAGGLSPRTVHHMHTVLKNALGKAVRWKVLAYNPCADVDPPMVERAKLSTYDLEQTATLIEAVRETRLLIPTMLAVLCGLRRGEIAALRWNAVNLTTGELSIEQSAEQTRAGVRYKEPKRGRTRTVALSPTMAEELRQHRIRQAEELFRVGIRASDDTFVCALEDGTALRPNTLTIYWARLATRLDLPRIRFHDLRHSAATHMLSLGVHPKVASERLGHSKVGITLDLYSHVMPGMQKDAALRVDEALQAAMKEKVAKR